MLSSLLNKDAKLDLVQDKTFRSLSGGCFASIASLVYYRSFATEGGSWWHTEGGQLRSKVLEQTYGLVTTDNKRELVYNDKGVLIGTIPYNINSFK